jgi:VIT1/CCC1 family predicted Fe2+/Mn2+ transporter
MSRLEHSHDSASIRRRLEAGPHVSYLRDLVYGGIDGAITTLAVVAGAMGADLSARVVLIMGMANLVGDGFSMAAANFSGTRAEVDEYARLRAMEERHLDLVPEGEREEVRQIYRRKGFEAGDLERAVAVVTADRARWIDAMMIEEHGQPSVLRTPWKAALGTFAAFLLCGSIPLLPFAANLDTVGDFDGAEPMRESLLAPWRQTGRKQDRGPGLLNHNVRYNSLLSLRSDFANSINLAGSSFLSLAATALVFFGIGSAKSRWSVTSWWRSGSETLAIGIAAAGLAFAVGYGLAVVTP